MFEGGPVLRGWETKLEDRGRWRIDEIDLTIDARSEERYAHRDGDHLSPSGETRYEYAFQREGWAVRTVTRTALTCTHDTFRLVADQDAWEGEARVDSRSWDVRIPRNGL